jgi:hypothetical protein
MSAPARKAKGVVGGTREWRDLVSVHVAQANGLGSCSLSQSRVRKECVKTPVSRAITSSAN